MDHYLNTAASDLSRARSVSLLNPMTPQPFPTLLMGTAPLHRFFAHNNGTIESWSGEYTLRVTLANALIGPLGGSAVVTAGAQTAPLPVDSDAEAVAVLLNAMTTIAADGGVDVTGEWPYFLVAYREVGVTTGFTVSAALLNPNASADLTVLTDGSVTERELLTLAFRQTSVGYSDGFSTISDPEDGWSGRIPLNTAAAWAWMQQNGTRYGDYLQASTLITVEAIDSDGNSTPLCQQAVIIRALNYQANLIMPIGPTRHASTSTAVGTTAVAPTSQIHTERITVTGTATTRSVTVSTTGLVAGARIDLVFILSGATDGTTLSVYADAVSGSPLWTFVRSGSEPTALLSLYFNGSSSFDLKESLIPAFYP